MLFKKEQIDYILGGILGALMRSNGVDLVLEVLQEFIDQKETWKSMVKNMGELEDETKARMALDDVGGMTSAGPKTFKDRTVQ